MKNHKFISGFLAIVFAASFFHSALAEPTPGYYNSATGLTGTQLRAALHDIINDHTVIPYSSTAADTSDALKFLDEDVTDTTSVFTLYAQTTRAKSVFGLSSGWNREHMWCNSYGLDDLRAEDSNVNSARGNKLYDISNPGDSGYNNPAYPEALRSYNANGDSTYSNVASATAQ